MKKILAVSLVLVASLVHGQDSDYKVVFDMTSKDSVNQQTLLRQLKIIRELNANSQLEVVVYGQGLNLVTQGGSTQQVALTQLLNDKKISVKVCAVTMQRNNVDKSQLIPGVEIVPDGIYEIIVKQREGWGYIKVAH